MKRFNKGYIYSGLLTDLLKILPIILLFLVRFFLLEGEKTADASIAVILFFAITFVVYFSCCIAYRIMYYKTAGYELTETEIKCNRGVFFRKRSVLDYKKVHAIDKRQNIFHRIFGIAILMVDSGSANTPHQAEITIIENSKIVDA